MSRVFVSLTLALLGVFATTEAAFAASERDEVIIWTVLVALGVMAFLLLVYAIKWYFGGDQMPPPEPDAGEHGGHH